MKVKNKLANLLGYELINKKTSDLILDSHLQRLLKTYRPSVIFDVGANTGQFGKKLRSAGFDGEIYSFEPVSTTFKELKNNIGTDSKWRVFNFALGAEKSEATIHVPKNASTFSSILPNNEYSKERFHNYLQDMREETISIKVLDELLADGTIVIPKEANIFLKLDTQGYDLNVLKGATTFLKNVQMLLTELSFIPLYEGMPTFVEMSEFLLDKGFTPTGFFPVSRDKKSLAVIEMDGFFVRGVR